MIECSKKPCDTCCDRFKCWTTRNILYFLVRRDKQGTASPHICYSIAGRYEYNDKEFTVALRDCENMRCFSKYTYTIETALDIEQLIKLGYKRV